MFRSSSCGDHIEKDVQVRNAITDKEDQDKVPDQQSANDKNE